LILASASAYRIADAADSRSGEKRIVVTWIQSALAVARSQVRRPNRKASTLWSSFGTTGGRSAKCRAGILDVDRMGRERHDARPAGETPAAFLVEGARSMIVGERPEARLLDIHFAKTIQSVVVKHASDASAPELWPHIQGLQNTVAHRDHSDGLVVLERNVGLPIRVGECGDPVRANRVIRELIDWWEHVLEARDRRSARDPETQLGVLHRRAHDSHARRKYCG
jgi:hypothetical protein